MRGYCLEHCWSTVRALWSTVSPCSPRLRCVRRSQSHGCSRSRWRSTLFAVPHPLCPSLALVTDAATLLLYVAQPSVSGFTSLFFLCHWLHKFFKILSWSTAVCLAQPVSGTVDGQNPAPPHHFTLEGSHSNPRAPSFNVGATPLRRWCRILDLQLVFVFSTLGPPQ